MFPPPLPLCVEREPERMAVSEVVRGAYESKDRQPIKLMTVSRSGSITHIYCICFHDKEKRKIL